MQITIKFVCIAGLASWATLASAQEAAPRPATIYRFQAPPSGFDAVHATDAERASYGLPTRPSQLAKNPVAYQTWLRGMSAAQTYVAPDVFATQRRHTRALTWRTTTSAGAASSQNWAGQTILGSATSFGPSSYAEVLSQWIVPAVQQPPGTCSGTDVSAIWVGIDGISGSTDVVQAGTEADTGCNTTPVVYPWFEWYPDYEYEITNFPVKAGTPLLVVVQATSATAATVSYVNLESRQYTVVGVSAPAGTTLHGNSAEWIVERPSVGTAGTLGTLADFGLAMITSEVAFLSSEVGTGIYDVPGAPGGGRTAYTVTMVDSSGSALAYSRPQGTSAQEVDATGATIR